MNNDSDSIGGQKKPLAVKHKMGDAANKWLARNRSLVLRQTPVWAQSLALIFISLGGIAIVGGVFFRIDEVVSVKGQLKSIGGTVEVMTPAGGRVAEVLFEDGDYVEKGKLLMRFDTRRAISDKEMLASQINFEEKQLEASLKSLASQKLSLESQLDVLRQRLETKRSIVKDMELLVSQGGFQRLQYLEQKDQLFGLQRQVADIEEQMIRIGLQADKISLQSLQLIDKLKAELHTVELQIQYQNVVSPVSGVVFDPQIRKESVINGGERILSVVPQEGLYAEVFVPNKDIGYIKIGQEAAVRVDAFPFSRYGEIPGNISHIGADALEPSTTQSFYRFPVKLQLERSTLDLKGASIPLKPGMSISTNLKLRDKRVISLISDIFVDQTDSIRSLRQQ